MFDGPLLEPPPPPLTVGEGLRTAAVAWALRGFKIFPCRPGTKKPLIEGWQKNATSDPRKVYDIWTNHAHPQKAAYEFNVGYATDGLAVVDLDTKDDPNVVAIYRHEYYGEFDTLEVASGSGGPHLIYRDPEYNVRSVQRLDGHMIDTRAMGGLALAPGSVVNGGIYRLVADRPILPVSAFIRAACGLTRVRSEGETAPMVDLDHPGAVMHAAAVAKHADGAMEGSRGSTAYKIALRIRDAGISEDVCLAVLEEHWAPRCDPPFPTESSADVDGLRVTIENAYRYAQNPIGSKSPEAAFGDRKVEMPPETPEPAAKSAIPPPPSSAHAAPSPRPRFDVFTAEEIEARPDLQQLILGYIWAGLVHVVFGPPEIGKTFIILRMLFCLATGTDFAGREILNPAGHRVVYWVGEGIGGMPARIRAQKVYAGLAAVPNLRIMTGSLDLRELNDARVFVERLRPFKPEVVVWDTWSRANPGTDEGTGDTGLSVAVIDYIRAELGCAVIIVAHTGKDQDRGIRGSTVLDGALDVAAIVTPNLDKTITMKMTYCKEGEIAAPIEFQLHKVAGSGSVVPVVVDKPVKVGPDGALLELVGQEKVALHALHSAISDRPQASGAKRVCTLPEWRKAYATLRPGKSYGANQKAFLRAHEGVIEKGYATLKDNWVTLADLTQDAPEEVDE